MPLPVRRPSIDFPLGGIELAQTSRAINSMLSDPDDDLLVVGYGCFDAQTLNSLGIGEWLKVRSDRHVMLVLGLPEKLPVWEKFWTKPWSKATYEFGQLLRLWAAKGVPLGQVHAYGAAHWHVKIAATLRKMPGEAQALFSGPPDSELDRDLTYDSLNYVTGYVTEAIIGSSNATDFAMRREGNFELDVHITRNVPQPQSYLPLDSAPELGALNGKLCSLLRAMTAEVNNPATTSAKATAALRAELQRRLPRAMPAAAGTRWAAQ
jgi:hypothetical protein